MNRLWPSVFGLLLSPGAVPAPTLSPQDFAYGLPVITTKEAAAYRFALPLAVYQGTYRENLADLRVFNARGDAVPFSLLRPAAQPPARKAAPESPSRPHRPHPRLIRQSRNRQPPVWVLYSARYRRNPWRRQPPLRNFRSRQASAPPARSFRWMPTSTPRAVATVLG